MNVCETLKIQVYSLPSNDLSDYPELKSATKTDIKLVYDIYKHIRLFTVKVKIERNEVYYQIDSVKKSVTRKLM